MDFFETKSTGLESPANRHYSITPANEDLPIRPRAIFVAADGDVVIRDEGGIDITYAATAGDILPFRAVQVRTGTTATCVAWY